MKQLFAACFGSDAVSLQTKIAMRRVPQETSSCMLEHLVGMFSYPTHAQPTDLP